MKDFYKNIEAIENTVGYTFRDKSLLCQAFTRSSWCNEHKGRGDAPQSNEVLEFFGDSALSLAIVTFFISESSERYRYGVKTELDEGDFSSLRSRLSDKSNLSENIARLGLEKYLIMGEGDKKLGLSSEPSVMEDLFESIIGAIYIDCSYNIETVMKSVAKMLDTSVYMERAARDKVKNYKGLFQEWCADKSRKMPTPVYKKVSESGPDHEKEYVCAAYVGDKKFSEGRGKSLKAAQTEAARLALLSVGYLKESKK